MDNFSEQFEKIRAYFQQNSGFFAAVVGFFIYFFNYYRRRDDARVDAKIEAHERRIESHDRRMLEQMSFVEQEIAGLNNNIIFQNMQNLEMVKEIKALQEKSSKIKRYYRRTENRPD